MVCGLHMLYDELSWPLPTVGKWRSHSWVGAFQWHGDYEDYGQQSRPTVEREHSSTVQRLV